MIVSVPRVTTSDPWCVNCDGRVGHKFSDCPSGRTTPLTPCKHCGKKELHYHWNCPSKPAGAASHFLCATGDYMEVNRSDVVNKLMEGDTTVLNELRSSQAPDDIIIFIPQFKRGQGTVAVLVDSGGSFSCISLRLVKQLGLMHLVQKPVGTRTLGYASAALSTRRLGKITLPMTLHFPHESNHDVVHMTVELEVLDIRHDFLVGSEMIRVIWAGENIARYSIAPSPISRPPTNVHTSPRDESIIRQYFSGATPRVDVLSTLTSSSSSSGSSSRSARVHAANQVPPASAHASTSASPADAHREQ